MRDQSIADKTTDRSAAGTAIAMSPVVALSIAAELLDHAGNQVDEVAARTGEADCYRGELFKSADAALESVMCHPPQSIADAALILMATARRFEEISTLCESKRDSLTCAAIELAFHHVTPFLVRNSGEDVSSLFKGRMRDEWRKYLAGEHRTSRLMEENANA